MVCLPRGDAPSDFGRPIHRVVFRWVKALFTVANDKSCSLICYLSFAICHDHAAEANEWSWPATLFWNREFPDEIIDEV